MNEVLWTVIKPIPKSNTANVAKDYRPIALTSVLSKTFERVTKPLLTKCLTDDSQFACREHRSTEDALTVLLDTVTEHLDANSKNYARCLFVDFTSAFNTISPTLLVDKLKSASIHNNMLNLIYSFLVNRKQWVATKEAKSLVKTSSTGSPQGCVWSPILFSIYVQDMPILSMGNYHLIKYADDTILLELCYTNVQSTLPAAAECLTSWFSSQDLLLNVSKTKQLIFTKMRDNRACDPLVINGTAVEQVESFVYRYHYWPHVEF